MPPTSVNEPSLLICPITMEQAQQIHFEALHQTLTGLWSLCDLPRRFDTAYIKQMVRMHGWDACLLDPQDIGKIFQGVTSRTLQHVRELWCSPLERSISMVHQILAEHSHKAGNPVLSYEAIWAICLYYTRIRHKTTDTCTELTNEVWVLASMPIHLPETAQNQLEHKPSSLALTYLLNQSTDQIISFSIHQSYDQRNAAGLVLYNGLASKRQPAPRAPTGLCWPIPTSILLDGSLGISSLPLHTGLLPIRKSISADIIDSDVVQKLASPWTTDLSQHQIQPAKLIQIIDNLLFRWQGVAPFRQMEELAHDRGHLRGYSREPGELIPDIRDLLHPVECQIQNNAILYDGLHYTHELLHFFPNESVTFRLSPWHEYRGWVYLNGEILCEVYAMELQRNDGSYRRNRPDHLRSNLDTKRE